MLGNSIGGVYAIQLLVIVKDHVALCADQWLRKTTKRKLRKHEQVNVLGTNLRKRDTKGWFSVEKKKMSGAEPAEAMPRRGAERSNKRKKYRMWVNKITRSGHSGIHSRKTMLNGCNKPMTHIRGMRLMNRYGQVSTTTR